MRFGKSQVGISDQQARGELGDMTENRGKLQSQTERLERLLQADDSGDNWTVEPLADKARVLVTAERGQFNEEGWLRTCVVLSLDTLESLDDDELVQEVHTRVKVYRVGM